MQGPVHGVTSGNSWPHTARASLGSDGMLRVWVDGRPLLPVEVGLTSGYIGLASYNLLGNDVGRVKHVTVVGETDGAAPAFDKTVPMGRGFHVVAPPGTNACEQGKSVGCVVTTHVARMVRAPNGDLIAPNGGTLLRTKDNGSTWSLDSPSSGGLTHMMNIQQGGKPALANLRLRANVKPPCPDCALPTGTTGQLIRQVSTDSGKTWTAWNGPKSLIGEIQPPPLDCKPTPFDPGINCSEIGWRDWGFNSILPLRDGKTVLAFGSTHNGDLLEMAVNDRTFIGTYHKNVGGKPVPSV